MPSVSEIYGSISDQVGSFFGKMKKDAELLPKPVGDRDIASWVAELFDEATKDRDALFAATKQLRLIREYTGSPESFYKACELLEAGNSWEVYGHRNVKPGEDWKQERVDGETQRQMRARNNYLTAAWHDITVNPDIANIDVIFDQEREKMDWGRFMKRYVKAAQCYGEATAKIVLDRTVEQDIFKPVVCDRGTLLRSPYSRSMKKEDGCWYVIHATSITDKQVSEQYPELNVGDLAARRENRDKTQVRQYVHTKSYWKLECWMDDDTVEKVEATDQDREDVVNENARFLNGEKVEAGKDQHHIEHLRGKLEALSNLMDMEPENDEEMAVVLPIMEAYQDNILGHIEQATSDDLAPAGYRKLYPHGRLVVVISDKVAQDEPNPYLIDWRKLFVGIKNEDVISRVDGRGDPEILYNQNKALDTQLSRIEDAALASAFPQKYRHKSDRAIVDADGEDNDPLKTQYYNQTPPIFIKSEPPNVLYELYRLNKTNAQNSLGVNEITFGKAPTSNASGELADTLLRQNEQIITGEMNQELVDAVKSIVESLLALYRIFYKEERQYFIKGDLEKVNVSNILSYRMVVGEDGTMQEIPIEAFEINVEPQSSYPMKWERRMAFLTRFATLTYPDGTPIVPPAMIREELASKFPELGENGKYYQEDKATAIGMKILSEQAQMAAMEEQNQQSVLKQAGKKFISQNIPSAKATNGRNGNNVPQQ